MLVRCEALAWPSSLTDGDDLRTAQERREEHLRVVRNEVGKVRAEAEAGKRYRQAEHEAAVKQRSGLVFRRHRVKVDDGEVEDDGGYRDEEDC